MTSLGEYNYKSPVMEAASSLASVPSVASQGTFTFNTVNENNAVVMKTGGYCQNVSYPGGAVAVTVYSNAQLRAYTFNTAVNTGYTGYSSIEFNK